MKNKLLFLFSLVLIIGFSACNDNNDNFVPENPNRAYVVTLNKNNWQRESNSRIKFDIPLRDLTDYYILQGGVAVAISRDGEEKTYDILPANFEGLAYSVNYAVGWVTIYIEDPLAEDVTVPIPNYNIIAKIILSDTDYVDYQGFFNLKSNEFDFKPLNIEP